MKLRLLLFGIIFPASGMMGAVASRANTDLIVIHDELLFAFVCRTVGGEIAATDEADKCGYFEIERIPSNTAPKHVGRIHDAISRAIQPVFRRQTEQSTREMVQVQREALMLRGENGG